MHDTSLSTEKCSKALANLPIPQSIRFYGSIAFSINLNVAQNVFKGCLHRMKVIVSSSYSLTLTTPTCSFNTP